MQALKRPNYENSLAHLFPEIAKQWDEEKNGDLTPEHVTPGSNKRVWWNCLKSKCGCEHNWIVSVSNRVKKNCPYCSKRKTCPCNSLATRTDVMRWWHPTRNQGIDPSTITQFSNKLVWWKCQNVRTCECEHDWKTTVWSVTSGTRCPFCANLKICLHTSLAYNRPDVMEFWHPTKNKDIDPNNVSVKSGLKVWWRCSKDVNRCGCYHEWKTSISHVATGKRCPYCCANPLKVCTHKSLKTVMPEVMKFWHPTKNSDIDPDTISCHSNLNVWWICVNDINKCGCTHEWRANINDIVKGTRCPYCCNSAPKNVCVHNSIANLRPDAMKFWHPTKNVGLDPNQISCYSNAGVWWRCENLDDCKCSHEWFTSICGLRGCPYCADPVKKVCVHKSLFLNRPDLMKEWDTENILDPKEVSLGSGLDAKWTCQTCKYKWTCRIIGRTNLNFGCPKCSRSNMERQIEITLRELSSSQLWKVQEFKQNCWQIIQRQELDVYIKLELASTKEVQCIAVEMDGGQHFKSVDFFGGDEGFEKTKERDARKNNNCESKHIHLLRIGFDVKTDTYTKILTSFFDQVAQNPKQWNFQCKGSFYK